MHHYDDERMMEVGRRDVKSEQASYQQGGTQSEPVPVLTPPSPIRFRVDGIPIAQPRQRHRIIQSRSGTAFVHNYTPAKSPVADFKARVAWAARQVYRGEPLTVPVRVEILAIFPAASSFKAAQRRQIQSGDLIPYTGRNDWDNLGKSICDALNGVLWDDDRRIYDGRVGRYYGSSPGVSITVWRDGQGVTES